MNSNGRAGTRRTIIAGVVVLALSATGCDWRGGVADGRADRVATAERHELRQATFVLLDGADVVRVRSADLGGDLYRVSTPAKAKVRPAVSMDDGTVLAGLAAAAGGGPALVEVVLHESVRWRVRLSGGAREETLDLRSSRLDEVEFEAGTGRAEVILPPATGTVRVTMRGGASRFLVRLTGDAPVRVRAAGGAASLTVDGVTRTGVAGGTVVEPPAWAGAQNRYDIDAVAGVAELLVERT